MACSHAMAHCVTGHVWARVGIKVEGAARINFRALRAFC